MLSFDASPFITKGLPNSIDFLSNRRLSTRNFGRLSPLRERMFLMEDFPCLFRRTMESKPRPNAEALVSISVFLATVAAAFVTFIELNLQSLGYFYVSSNLRSVRSHCRGLGG